MCMLHQWSYIFNKRASPKHSPTGRNMFLPAQGYAVPQTLRERLLLVDELAKWVLQELERVNPPGHVRGAITRAAKGVGGGPALWAGWRGTRAQPAPAAQPSRPPAPPKPVRPAAPWDKLGLEGTLPPHVEPMSTAGYVQPKNPRAVPKGSNLHRYVKDADWPRVRGLATNMLVRGCTRNNNPGIQVSLLPAMAAHGGWCPVAVLAHAIDLDVDRTLAMVTDSEEMVDNLGSMLFTVSEDRRWVSPLVGSWQMELAGTAGSPAMVQYNQFLAGYPANHWVHAPPPPLTMGTYHPRPSSKKKGEAAAAAGDPAASTGGASASSYT